MLKPIVRTFWRKGNCLAVIASAKNRLREVQLNEEANKLEVETKGITDYDEVIKVIRKYCDVR